MPINETNPMIIFSNFLYELDHNKYKQKIAVNTTPIFIGR